MENNKKYSVDDILAEIDKKKSIISKETVDSIINKAPVSADTAVFKTQTEEVKHHALLEEVKDNAPLLEEVKYDAPVFTKEEQQEKIDSFLKSSSLPDDNTRMDSGLDNTQNTKIDDSFTEIFKVGKKRAPHALTADEVLGVKEPIASESSEARMFLTAEEIRLDDLNKNKPDEGPFPPKDFSENKTSSPTAVYDSAADHSREISIADEGIDIFKNIDAEGHALEYNDIEDSHDLRVKLRSRVKASIFGIFFTGIFAAALFMLTAFPFLDIALPDAVNLLSNPEMYLYVVTGLFAGAALINITLFINVFKSIFRLKIHPDSPPVIAFIACGLQLVYYFEHTKEIAGAVLLTSIAAFSVVFYHIGKLTYAKRVMKNFDIVSSVGVKKSVFMLSDKQASMIVREKYTQGTGVCADRSTVNLKGFISHSKSPTPSDNISKNAAVFSFFACIATAVLAYFNYGGNMDSVYFMAAAAACTAIPVASIIAGNLPLMFAAGSLNQIGGMLAGYNAVDEFSSVNHVCIDAGELFPDGSVEVAGIKTYEDVPVDKAIVAAASIAIRTGGPLACVFDKMIEGRRTILQPVDSLIFDDTKGITGKVGGVKTRLGNRILMESAGITGMPDFEDEQRLLRGGRHTVYLSVDERLVALFILKYTVTDEELEYYVNRLAFNGVTIHIKSADPNITPDLLSKLFEIPKESVSIMQSSVVNAYDNITQPMKSSSGMLAHKNSFAAFAATLCSCFRIRTVIMISTIFQSIFVAAGIAAIIFLKISGETSYLVPHIFLLWHAVCFVLIALFSTLSKPS